ncbi:MAG: choloylglycine hydrolase [Bacteroidales bacterium]|nr:choloylglycine hydrolase [Bacteroidales bacterium]
MKKTFKILRNIFIVLLILIISFTIYFAIRTKINIPEPSDFSVLEKKRLKIKKNFYKIGNNWLKKSETAYWELYIEGNNPFELGAVNGMLTKELINIQEQAFTNKIYEFIPSKFYLRFLKYFIGWFNRDIDKFIDEEYLMEIYGVSLSASKKYEYISDNYRRMLNYHAAHDIGHALSDFALIGCTSFSVWDNKAIDSCLLIGRNFDFYFSDEFAKNKVITFINPPKGYKFVSVSWASMIGVLSGMNETGLTVTINASKSDIPTKAATPISILSRKILQYAKNIDEAIEIAKNSKTFVSESIMIGSAIDNKTVIIEKSPNAMDVFISDNNYIVCSNHFQSKAFKENELNIENIINSSSLYRQQRCEELISSFNQIGYKEAAYILRNKNGKNNKNIGFGNEKAMNQLISHHSVIFMPKKKIMWVSTYPYQLGKYIAYNLDSVFNLANKLNEKVELYNKNLTIPNDTFLLSDQYDNYVEYKKLKVLLNKAINKGNADIKEKIITKFINLNPEYYYSYFLAGNYYLFAGKNKKALEMYQISLTKEVKSLDIKKKILIKISEIEKL